jgi:hypothetical protein
VAGEDLLGPILLELHGRASTNGSVSGNAIVAAGPRIDA